MIYVIVDATNYPVEAFQHSADAHSYVSRHPGTRMICMLLRSQYVWSKP